ncbi:helix-turn-helix domain-containing protein [Leeia sp. TBRC 13508]|uniref:Helix-turn-helix domain-containing protein n=1 Tax=Leeia speluncae TaxID=2884804 RepID=A0ABS8D2E3_9NEIS|nr:helix-turn-helix domain-containing protein [Leeia speluncae]MCB6182364.1 helix-turn-helix domain-containing protein [Leeia speluncae]
MKPLKQISIGFILDHGFTLSTLANFLDAIRLASDDQDQSRQFRFTWDIVSSSGQYIRTSSKLELIPTKKLEDHLLYDYLVIIGGTPSELSLLDDSMLKLIENHWKRNKRIVGLGGGVFLLAQSTKLRGYQFCVSRSQFHEFTSSYPEIHASSEALFLQDRNLYTCAGGIGTAQLAAQLITSHYGKMIAEKSLRIMIENINHDEVQTQPSALVQQRINNRNVRIATEIIEKNLKTPLTIPDIANQINISTRQLERLFISEMGLTPAEYIKKTRMHLALKYLLNTDFAIEHIAKDTGFLSNSHFSKAFRQAFQCTPREMRKRSIQNGATNFQRFD